MTLETTARVVRLTGLSLMAAGAILGGARQLPAQVQADQAPQTREANATSDQSAEDENDTHQKLRALRDKLVDAVNQRQIEELLALLHPKVVLTAQDGSQLGTVRGRDGVRAYVERMLIGPNHGVESLQVRPDADSLTLLYHNDTGVAFGKSVDHYRLVDGSEFDLKTRWSATLVRENNQWLVASLHVSSNLFENPVLDVYRRRGAWLAIGAGLAGLVLGVVVAQLLRRRPSS